MELAKLRRSRAPHHQTALERDLAHALQGEVRFDRGSRALYATDASNYRQVPIGVVVPRTTDDVVKAIGICREHQVPLVSRGGGTSLAGQACNEAVVLEFSKYLHRVVRVDPQKRLATVQPGVVLDDLRRAAQSYGLTYGPDPATHDRCTLGGMIGNNSCGVHSVLSEFYGPGPRTEHQVESLEVVTYDGTRMHVGATSEEELRKTIAAGGRQGQIYGRLRELRDKYASHIRSRFPSIQRRVSGYNLPQLLAEQGFHVARALTGTEGTCVTILQATVRLVPQLPGRVLLVLGYPSVFEAADHIAQIRELRPVGCEAIDDRLVQFMRIKHLHAGHASLLPEGKGWLLVEFGAGTVQEALEAGHAAMKRLGNDSKAPSMVLYEAPDDQARVWQIRESGLGATAFVPGMADSWPGWEDAAVPPERVGAYLGDFQALLSKYELACSLYGHFAQGCVHCRIPFDLRSERGVRHYRAFTHEAAELVVRYGGALSGEHGDGQSRADLLEVMYGPELVEAFRQFKGIFDPDRKMNPGKVVNPHPRDSDLRLARYPALRPGTHFRFPADDGQFEHAAMRCVGVGKCRKMQGGTMCPSYMVTREEEHSPRGRAHLLFEMLQGEVVQDGWRSEEVKDALELCLSCKGCTSECPVTVDIPTYKAEFLSHYYKRRLRPRSAYAFGLIHWWAALGSKMPRVANRVTQSPTLGPLAKWAAGMAPQRSIPPFAHETFRSWFARRRGQFSGPERADARRRVMLWPDTFNNHFFPHVLAAATEVLERAGCEVVIPSRPLCCGRPLYDYGMLDLATRLWRRTMGSLRKDIEAGVALVGVEPSCVAAFRNELRNLFVGDPVAERLSKQTYTLGELLEQLDGYRPPSLRRRALVHGHCHHKAVMGMAKELSLLNRMHLQCESPDSGCCGMAGAFGFEKDKYNVSMVVGERVLLPAVRQADAQTLVVADGFSCREQIAQSTGRRALHTAEVVQLAHHESAVTTLDAGERAERRFGRGGAGKALVAGAVVGAIAVSLWVRSR